jgi:hypothetical protein
MEETTQLNELDNTEEIGTKRKDDGTFDVGTAPGPGRPADTPEQKIVKRAIKELVKEYKEDLAQILPQIKPVIEKRALEGDMTAIKEIHDRVMDKSKQPTDITSDGEKINQVLVKFLDGTTNDHRDTPGVQETI